MTPEKDSVKTKALLYTGRQEATQNVSCHPVLRSLCTSASCLEYCPASNPVFLFKANVLGACAVTSLNAKAESEEVPLGAFDQVF